LCIQFIFVKRLFCEMAEGKKKVLWPMLDASEMLQVLGELGIALVMEQLKQPSAELAFNTYRALAERVWNLTSDDLTPSMAVLEAFEYAGPGWGF
jgi:hypothetical protein